MVTDMDMGMVMDTVMATRKMYLLKTHCLGINEFLHATLNGNFKNQH
jgi:hypothetical protein